MMRQFNIIMIVCMFWADFSPLYAKPLRIEITQGIVKPMPIAIPDFLFTGSNGAQYAKEITQVITSDLTGTGLFRKIPQSTYIGNITNFSSPIQFTNWKAINAQALITGSVTVNGNKLIVKFRLFDVFSQMQMGDGLQFQASKSSWRRMAHKVADAVYTRITGEGPYFDSRVVYIAETGSKNIRRKRLAIMDYDGANIRYLTDDKDIVIAPRFSPNNKEIVYTSYTTGKPKVYIMNVDTLRQRELSNHQGMAFAPRFSPNGRHIAMSLTENGNTDIYLVNQKTAAKTRLTSGSAIDTAPSFSPDGSQIVFESDRSGRPQLYIMPSRGGIAKRISFGKGSYGTPVWSPRGDLIAFTKISKGRFHIGIMRVDGSNERLLTASFLDEGPTWSPNGRVIMFFRETAGVNGVPSLYSVDITGRNLKRVNLPSFGSDPAWSGVLAD